MITSQNLHIQNDCSEMLESFSKEPFSDLFEHFANEMQWFSYLLWARILRLRQTNFYETLKKISTLFIFYEKKEYLVPLSISEVENSTTIKNGLIEKFLEKSTYKSQRINQTIEISVESKSRYSLMVR